MRHESNSLYHPRHWLSWFALGLLRLIALLPLGILLRAGEGLGWMLWKLGRDRRAVVETNLKLCFPSLPEEKRHALARAHFLALGRGIFETPVAWWASDSRLKSRCEVRGLEHLQAALDEGGVLLLTGHFTTLEIGARFLATHLDFHVMYRHMNDPIFNTVTRRARERGSRRPSFTRDEIRKITKALRAGGAVWFAPDQALRKGGADFVEFFGVQTLTVTASSRLAKMGRAKVVPYFPQYLGRGRYRINLYPALENFPGEDDIRDTRRILELLEGWILAAPEQYWWVHRRFKWRPDGQRSPYSD